MFQKVRDLCIEKAIFKTKKRSWIPIEFKILIALGILGRGNCCDDLNEFSSVGESTCNSIFHKFVKEFVDKFFIGYVCMPSEETLKQSCDIYAKLGIPGTVFSMDCTHVTLDKCPIEFANICTGKEGKPTLAFQLAVDHFRRIFNCSQYFYGSHNDKTISHNDPFVRAVINGSLQNIKIVLILLPIKKQKLMLTLQLIAIKILYN